jgi:hypothetical protein
MLHMLMSSYAGGTRPELNWKGSLSAMHTTDQGCRHIYDKQKPAFSHHSLLFSAVHLRANPIALPLHVVKFNLVEPLRVA